MCFQLCFALLSIIPLWNSNETRAPAIACKVTTRMVVQSCRQRAKKVQSSTEVLLVDLLRASALRWKIVSASTSRHPFNCVRYPPACFLCMTSTVCFVYCMSTSSSGLVADLEVVWSPTLQAEAFIQGNSTTYSSKTGIACQDVEVGLSAAFHDAQRFSFGFPYRAKTPPRSCRCLCEAFLPSKISETSVFEEAKICIGVARIIPEKVSPAPVWVSALNPFGCGTNILAIGVVSTPLPCHPQSRDHLLHAIA